MAKTYNKKEFIAPDSIYSTSAIHCKVYNDGEAVIRISDCNQSIRIWNNTNTEEGLDEMILKVVNIRKNLQAYLNHLNTIKAQYNADN